MEELNHYQRLSARGKTAIRLKKVEGQSMHQAPLGYRNVRTDDGRVILKRHPKKFKLVQEARQMWQEGRSLRAICRAMRSKGLRSKRGKVIGTSSMYEIVKR
ncbi:MAG: hypothetical protein HONBIEJF_02546 [Fimbriimonadaceae bacterium]|nr:hypothetical protein [Fimbriimonadaceae bacterium]